MKVVGIYLAAGSSRRMGKDKLILDIGGVPLGSKALQAALDASLPHVLVITKSENDPSWIPPALFTIDYRKKWTAVRLSESNQGQAYSIQYGLTKAIHMQADAVLVLLADQPFVTAHIINSLLEAYQREPAKLFFACSFQGIIRPPVLITKNFFPQLMGLQGDRGAGYLLNGEFREKGKVFAFDDEAFFFDVDTMDDYLKLDSVSDKA